MTLTAIDAFVEHGDAQVVVRCDCGETVTVYDTLDTERAIDQAYELHPCQRCVACGEPLDDFDKQFNVLACTPCRMDDPEGTEAAVTAYIESMTSAQMRDYLNRTKVA